MFLFAVPRISLHDLEASMKKHPDRLRCSEVKALAYQPGLSGRADTGRRQSRSTRNQAVRPKRATGISRRVTTKEECKS